MLQKEKILFVEREKKTLLRNLVGAREKRLIYDYVSLERQNFC